MPEPTDQALSSFAPPSQSASPSTLAPTPWPNLGRTLAASAALAAALTAPLYFVVFTERIFEAEKAGLLRLLGAIAAAGLITARIVERREGRGRPHAARSSRIAPASRFVPSHLPAPLRSPLATAALATWLATAIATLLSVAPLSSLLGSNDRGQGLLTSSALLALFAAAAYLGTDRCSDTRDALATAIAAAALPAALYGVLQRYGLDPLPWLGDVVTRVSGPAGSSVLFAAHLAMALPFVALCAARAWREAARSGRRLDLALAVWLATLCLTLWALVLAGSRGPVLGLAGGAVVATLAWAARARARRTALATLLIAGGLGLGVLGLNATRDHLGPALEWPLVGRIAVALDPSNSTTRVRLRLWEGSVDALADRGGLRSLVGAGPETMPLIWAPYYPPILAHDEPRGVVPDRAHNLMLDTLLGEGWLGLIALVAFFTAAVDTALGLLGLRSSPRRRATWLASWLGTGTAAAALALAFEMPALAGPASGLGAAAGLALWLAWQALATPRRQLDAPRSMNGMPAQPQPSSATGFALAALATIVVAWLEQQVGFGVTATRLLLWLSAGGLLGAAWSLRDAASATHVDALRPSPRPTTALAPPPDRVAPPDAASPPAFADPAFAPLVVGATLIFAFARPGLVGGGTAIVALLLGAGGLGVARMFDCRGRALLAVAALLFGQLVGQGLILAAGTRGVSDALPGAMGSLGLYLLVLLGAILWRSGWAPTHPPHHRSATPIALAIVVPALLLAAPFTLLPTAADAAYKEGLLAWEQPVMGLAERGESGRAEAFLDQAIERYATAVRLAPEEPLYRLRLGYAEDTRAVLLDQRLARTLAQAGQAGARDEYDPELLDGYALDLAARRDAAFEAALAHFEQARRRSDGSPAPVLARARALRLWGDLTRSETRRAQRLAEAHRTYTEDAVRVAPRWPEVPNEAALTLLLNGRPDFAAQLARQSIALDPYYYAPWKTLATALAETGEVEEAAEAWSRYFQDPRNAGDTEALRAQLGALLAADRPRDAVEVGRRLVLFTPNEARAHADLAVALERTGDPRAALDAARTAATLAPGDPEIAALLGRLSSP